ncbi:MAG: hypothetical protein AAF696_08280 [Bacteroidota bacterium]
MYEIQFSERQNYRQIWVWVLLLSVAGLFIWGIVQQVFLNIPFGNQPAPDSMLLALSFVPMTLIGMFLYLRLDTDINGTGIRLQYRPFHGKPRFIDWNDVKKVELKKVNPWKFGGWGLRFSGSSVVYSVGGNVYLKLSYSRGRALFIGTQKPKELLAALKKCLPPGKIVDD